MIAISTEELDALRSRIIAARWPRADWIDPTGDEWTAGTPDAELRRLAAYWADGYDWRRYENEINALPWNQADIAGSGLNYLRFDADGAGALPLVLTNGWPSSFFELIALARRLQPDFTVVVPCLPGFPLGPHPSATGTDLPTHELWHRLMHDELGFPRYGAHGGDLGAGITSLLGQAYPGVVAGIHLMSIADPPEYDAATLTSEERDYRAAVARWYADEGAYEHQQMTRPATLSYGLSDSPVGLLAWLLEKYHAWYGAFSDDEILTQASLYWHTGTIATSFRPYWEFGRGRAERVRWVEAPTAIAVFPNDLSQPPRSWAQRTYNVVRYTRMPHGGHFAPHQETELLAADITAFFKSLH